MDRLAQVIDAITGFVGTEFGSNFLRAAGGTAGVVAALFTIALTVRTSGRRWWSFFRRRLRDDLKLVDAQLNNRDSGTYEIDIKLRNVGNQPILIQQIVIQIKDALQLEYAGSAASALAVTESYNVLLSPHNVPRSITIPASQIVKPNDADRFLVILDSDTSDTFYKFSVQLTCNEDRSVLKVGMFVLYVEDLFNAVRPPALSRLHGFMTAGAICNDNAKRYFERFKTSRSAAQADHQF